VLVLAEAAAWVTVTAVLSFQTLAELTNYLDVAGAVVQSQLEFGNLLGPLKTEQIFGIWLSGDYRVPPAGGKLELTHVLIVLAAISAAAGLAWSVWRRAWQPLAFVAVSLIAWAYVTHEGSPWADGKALMIASPAVLLAVMLGVVAVASLASRSAGIALACVLGAGVLGSTALAFHDVSLAPRDRLGELARIGEGLNGQGPTLYTEFEEFGKHFLRRGAPEGTSEGWQRRYGPYLVGHRYPGFGSLYDLDALELSYIEAYRTLVIRKGSAASRPPVGFRLTEDGRFYEVWQRDADAPRPLQHYPLGSRVQRGALPDCKLMRGLARAGQRAGGRLAYVTAGRSLVIFPTRTAFPPSWYVDQTDPFVLRPVGPGTVRSSVVARSPGKYVLWVEGSFGRGLEVEVDGKHIGRVRYSLNGRGAAVRVAEVDLTVGRHVVELIRGGGDLHPGSGLRELFGPVVFAPVEQDPYRVGYVEPQQYRRLCTERLDWVEVVKP
jgi:hypothetical protein